MSDLTLYSLTDEAKAALDNMSALVESGDLPQEALTDTMEGLLGEVNDKANAVACYARNIDGNISALEAHKKEIDKRIKGLKAKQDWFKGYLLTNMQKLDITKIECPLFTITRKKNPHKVVIDNEDKIPAEFKTTQEVVSIDKKGIKQALKDGPVSWAHLEQGESVTIK